MTHHNKTDQMKGDKYLQWLVFIDHNKMVMGHFQQHIYQILKQP